MKPPNGPDGRIPRRMCAAALLGCALMLVLPSAAGAQQASTDHVAKPDKDGWWSRQQPPEVVTQQLPEDPILPRPSLALTVPQDAVAVGSQFGEQDKVAAVGFKLDAPLGADVSALTLTLNESTSPASNINPDQAHIVACPISNFWGSGARSAPWAAQPLQVCDRARVEGSRSAAGAWTFDLRSMAALWLAPSSSVGQHGVLLSSEPPSDGIVQVSLLAVAGDASVRYSYTPPADTDEAPGPPATKRRQREARAKHIIEVTLASAQKRVPQGEVGRIPGWAFLLVPLVAALAWVVSYTLGPRGDPGAARRREGSISRALGRRRDGDKGGSP